MNPGLACELAAVFMRESDATLTSGASSFRDATDAEILEATRLDSIAGELLARGTYIPPEV